MAALWKHLCDSGSISWKEKKFELRLKEGKLLALPEESTEKAEVTRKCMKARSR